MTTTRKRRRTKPVTVYTGTFVAQVFGIALVLGIAIGALLVMGVR